MRGNLILVFLLLGLLISCKKKPEEVTPENKSVMDYLTNGSNKKWKLIKQLPLRPYSSCNATALRESDNVYTFSVDSTYNFDNGDILEDSGDNHCTDAASSSGEFGLFENDTKIWIQMTYNLDYNMTVTADPDTASIYSINDGELVLISKSDDGTDTLTFAKK